MHDELILKVPEDDAAIARALLEDVMTKAFAMTFPGAPTKGVAGLSDATGRRPRRDQSSGAFRD